MKPTLKEKKKECLTRLKLSGLCSQVIKDFERGQLYKSEGLGFLYYLNDREMAIVKDFEKKFNAVAYHTIHNYTEFGELLAILYVSSETEEWELDRADLKENITLAYVYNMDYPTECTDLGYIGFVPMIGGLMRTS